MSAPENDDADLLFPDKTVTVAGEAVPVREITVAGETVTVRELSYAQGVRLLPHLSRFMADLSALLDVGEGADDTAVLALLSDHPDAWRALILAASGRDAAWLDSLCDTDGMAMQILAWGANAGFFSRRLLLAARIGQELRSLTFSPTSSAPDSAPITTPSPTH